MLIEFHDPCPAVLSGREDPIPAGHVVVWEPGAPTRYGADGLRASGDLSRVLSIAAEDARNRAKIERARRRELSAYIAVVVIGFLVYLLVIALLDAEGRVVYIHHRYQPGDEAKLAREIASILRPGA